MALGAFASNVTKKQNWAICTKLFLSACSEMSWIASNEHCPEHKWGTYHGGDGTESS